MSLKAIKDAVELLRDVPGRSPILAQIADTAESEIAALEKAALTVSACGIAYPTQASAVSGAEWQDATMLFATIAKEAK